MKIVLVMQLTHKNTKIYVKIDIFKPKLITNFPQGRLRINPPSLGPVIYVSALDAHTRKPINICKSQQQPLRAATISQVQAFVASN